MFEVDRHFDDGLETMVLSIARIARLMVTDKAV